MGREQGPAFDNPRIDDCIKTVLTAKYSRRSADHPKLGPECAYIAPLPHECNSSLTIERVAMITQRKSVYNQGR